MKKIFILVMLIFVTGCSVSFDVGDSGEKTAMNKEISGVRNVELSSATELNLTFGDTESLEISAGEKVMDKIVAEQSGDTLTLGVEGVFSFMSPVVFNLQLSELSSLKVSGASEAKVGAYNTDDISFEISGASELEVDDLEVETLDLEVSGASDVDIDGDTVSQDVSLSGASDYDAKSFKSKEAIVDLSGASSAEIWVTEILDADLSGVSDLFYIGSPDVTQSISGGSDISSVGRDDEEDEDSEDDEDGDSDDDEDSEDDDNDELVKEGNKEILMIQAYYDAISDGDLDKAYNMKFEPSTSLNNYKNLYKNTDLAVTKDFEEVAEHKYSFTVDLDEGNDRKETYSVVMFVREDGLIDTISTKKTWDNYLTEVFTKREGDQLKIYVRKDGEENLVTTVTEKTGDSPVEHYTVFDDTIELMGGGEYLIFQWGGWEVSGAKVYVVDTGKLVHEFYTYGEYGMTDDNKYFYECSESGMIGGEVKIYDVPAFSLKKDLTAGQVVVTGCTGYNSQNDTYTYSISFGGFDESEQRVYHFDTGIID